MAEEPKIRNDRPTFVSKEELETNWERTFGRKKTKYETATETYYKGNSKILIADGFGELSDEVENEQPIPSEEERLNAER